MSRNIERLMTADGRTERILLTSNGSVFSGLYSEATEPRALVVALHGGGLNSGYFHGRSHHSLSLLTLGRSLGYSVLALDRPGYGSSTDVPDWRTTLAGQSETIWSVIDDGPPSWAQSEIALVGHSFGSMVALTMAADSARPSRVVGVEISGVGTTFATKVVTDIGVKPDRSMHWGDESFYPPGTFEPGVRPHAPMPRLEPDDALRWPGRVRSVAHSITCPVHITVAGQELNWSNPVEELANCFDRSSRVLVDTQPRCGHNISLSWSARPYHLRAFAFFDDCLNARASGHRID